MGRLESVFFFFFFFFKEERTTGEEPNVPYAYFRMNGDDYAAIFSTRNYLALSFQALVRNHDICGGFSGIFLI